MPPPVSIPPLPPGFSLDQAQVPPLPEGFVLDGQETPSAPPSLAQQAKRQLGLAGRTITQGALGIVNPFADAVGVIGNLPLQAYDAVRGNKEPSFRFETNHTAAQGRMLDDAGLPRPETTAEKVSDVVSQGLVGAIAGGPMTTALMGRIGLAKSPVDDWARSLPKPSRAPNPGAAVLEDAGVPLDRAQRSGGRFMQMLRSAVTNHPVTAGRAVEFTEAQQKAFNRAVLRSIGENADEATQTVMASAKQRIGSVFNEIGKQGANFDDALQAEIASIYDDALRTVPESALGPVGRNVDDILGAVDDAGRINGEQFIKIRSHLSELSDNADVGQVARKLEQSLLNALERTHPGQKAMLRDAADQWRSMRIIQGALEKGAERNISPLRLSNAIGTNQNAAMSVYGQGGDQRLVELAQAGRSVLPQKLPDSGTVPRGLMQAPLHAIATSPLYWAGQKYLLSAPRPLGLVAPGSGVMLPRAMGAATATASGAR